MEEYLSFICYFPLNVCTGFLMFAITEACYFNQNDQIKELSKPNQAQYVKNCIQSIDAPHCFDESFYPNPAIEAFWVIEEDYMRLNLKLLGYI